MWDHVGAPANGDEPAGASVPRDIALLRADIDRRRSNEPGRRVIIGLVGEPGAGKSTLAGDLVESFGGAASLVPMDGFHLSNAVLKRLDRRNRKGAPDTFDAHGFVHLVRRLRHQDEDVVYVPEFVRALDEPIAGAIAVDRATPVVLLEGNYLLLDEPPWREIRSHLDACWYLDLDSEVRLNRLTERHRLFGLAPGDARNWARVQDEGNAILIRQTRSRADLVIAGS